MKSRKMGEIRKMGAIKRRKRGEMEEIKGRKIKQI